MLSKIKSCGLIGIDGFMVDVEVDIGNGLPGVEIVGLPDAAISESKNRLRAAIKNSAFFFPSKKIIVNLAPASMKKSGPIYDLPTAVAILAASNQVKENPSAVFLGELSLDGELKSVNGVLPMVISAYKEGFSEFFVPFSNAEEASIIDGVTVYPAKTLAEVAAHLNGQAKIEPYAKKTDLFCESNENILDFADVKGQEAAKRALEIAAAGNHNILLIGSPGMGKTMLAQRMPSILPDLTFEEALEVTKVHSIAGVLSKDSPLVTKRPFRSPHHTISAAGLTGGGTIPKPGELSLAHNGVLFLDELPEFNRNVLEVMRQPLEDGVVTISRVSATLTYPCNIMLIASMNPCKCGYLGDSRHTCTCSQHDIEKYHSKISGPLLDRIDLHIEVGSLDYEQLQADTKRECSADIKKRVNKARQIQSERFAGLPIYSNAQMSSSDIDKFCTLGEAENNMLKMAYDRMGLSARAHSRILKVARTIADLDGSENIQTKHIAEAIQYRDLDRKFRI